MVNGKRYGWEDVTIALPHGILIDVAGIDYEDEKEVKEIYGKGSMPNGYGSGNYKASGKLTILREEFEQLLRDARAAGAKTLYGIPPFEITVSYSNEDQPVITDILHQCKFKKTGRSSKQGDEKAEVELEFLILGGIEWNGTPGDTNI